jgi:hypothetical protein
MLRPLLAAAGCILALAGTSAAQSLVYATRVSAGPDSTLVRTLLREAANLLQGVEGHEAGSIVREVVKLQGSLGWIDDGRATLRGAVTGWPAFSVLAIAQYRAGDLPGAIETTRLPAGVQDQAQALGSLLYSLPYDAAERLALVDSIPQAQQQVEALRDIARSFASDRKDTASAQALLWRAWEIARADTSVWSPYYRIDLPLALVRLGAPIDIEAIINQEPTVDRRIEALLRLAELRHERGDSAAHRRVIEAADALLLQIENASTVSWYRQRIQRAREPGRDLALGPDTRINRLILLLREGRIADFLGR